MWNEEVNRLELDSVKAALDLEPFFKDSIFDVGMVPNFNLFLVIHFLFFEVAYLWFLIIEMLSENATFLQLYKVQVPVKIEDQRKSWQ